MMAGYAFHVGLFHSLLFAGFHRRFHNVPYYAGTAFFLFLPDSEIAGWLNSKKK